jgi:chemotaxis protein methyltransferase CheR
MRFLPETGDYGTMRNADCVAFLKWCLPRLGLRWSGYRKVRGTICKRVARRMRALGLSDLDAYRAHLATHADEWPVLDAVCRIPISRFWRDREVFDCLAAEVLPALAAAAIDRGQTQVRVWSAGCASGEEPYSLRLAWSLVAEGGFPSVGVHIIATDADDTMLARAEAGLYRSSSLHELAPEMVDRAFRRTGDLHEIRPEFRRDIVFLRQDIRSEMPDGPFDLVLCRNLVFTYFDDSVQRDLLAEICSRLRPGAAFVIGAGEPLPEPHKNVVPRNGPAPIYRVVAP